MFRHYFKHIQLVHANRKEIPCPMRGCGVRGDLTGVMKHHWLVHFKRRRPFRDSIENSMIQPVNFKCPFCSNIQIYSIVELWSHFRQHRNQKIIHCVFNGCPFFTSGWTKDNLLRRHIFRVHKRDVLQSELRGCYLTSEHSSPPPSLSPVAMLCGEVLHSDTEDDHDSGGESADEEVEEELTLESVKKALADFLIRSNTNR